MARKKAQQQDEGVGRTVDPAPRAGADAQSADDERRQYREARQDAAAGNVENFDNWRNANLEAHEAAREAVRDPNQSTNSTMYEKSLQNLSLFMKNPVEACRAVANVHADKIVKLQAYHDAAEQAKVHDNPSYNPATFRPNGKVTNDNLKRMERFPTQVPARIIGVDWQSGSSKPATGRDRHDRTTLRVTVRQTFVFEKLDQDAQAQINATRTALGKDPLEPRSPDQIQQDARDAVSNRPRAGSEDYLFSIHTQRVIEAPLERTLEQSHDAQRRQQWRCKDGDAITFISDERAEAIVREHVDHATITNHKFRTKHEIAAGDDAPRLVDVLDGRNYDAEDKEWARREVLTRAIAHTAQLQPGNNIKLDLFSEQQLMAGMAGQKHTLAGPDAQESFKAQAQLNVTSEHQLSDNTTSPVVVRSESFQKGVDVKHVQPEVMTEGQRYQVEKRMAAKQAQQAGQPPIG